MDKYLFPPLVTGTLLLIVFAISLIAYLIIQKRKQNHYHNLFASHQKSLIDEQERTMNEIAADLHDNTAQMLSMAQRMLGDTTETITDTHIAGVMSKINGLLADIADEINYLGHSLNNVYLKNLGLEGVIGRELDYLSTSGKITCDFHLMGEYQRPEFEKELLIYRILQEAIHNTLKHAKATELRIFMHFWAEQLIIEIADNGEGYTTADEKKGGTGIANMYYRTELLKGKLCIDSTTGKGTRVRLTTPIN